MAGIEIKEFTLLTEVDETFFNDFFLDFPILHILIDLSLSTPSLVLGLLIDDLQSRFTVSLRSDDLVEDLFGERWCSSILYVLLEYGHLLIVEGACSGPVYLEDCN